MFCYLRIAGVTQVNSDGAGLVLEASGVLHGNVLLHGWWATDVSFYTTELPEYVAVTGFAGVRPEVVHICSALTYTLLVLLAAFVARGRARGAEGVVRALLAAGIVLAPQPTGPTQVLLGSPDHVGTAVPVLLLLLLLDWAAGPLVGAGRRGGPARPGDRRRPAGRGGRRRAAVPRLPDPGRADPAWHRRAGAAGAAASSGLSRTDAAPCRLGLAGRLVRGVARDRGGGVRPRRPAGLPADRAPGRVPHRQALLRPAVPARGRPRPAARRAGRARAVRRRLLGSDRRGGSRLRAGAPAWRRRRARRRRARRAAPPSARRAAGALAVPRRQRRRLCCRPWRWPAIRREREATAT